MAEDRTIEGAESIPNRLRYGKFTIHKAMLWGKDRSIVHKMFGWMEFIPHAVELGDPLGITTDFYGWSPLFEEAEEGQESPEYTIEITVGEDKSVEYRLQRFVEPSG